MKWLIGWNERVEAARATNPVNGLTNETFMCGWPLRSDMEAPTKRDRAYVAMEEAGIAGIVGSSEYGGELFGHQDGGSAMALTNDELPEGWGIVYVEHEQHGLPTTWVSVGPL